MSDGESKTLERRLSLINVWSIAFGGIIGWGSFVMPGTVFLKRAGPGGTLIAMEIAAFIMLIISYSYAYMMKRYPVSGGEFVYAKKAFGATNGFICAWFLSLCYICIIPMNATALCLIFRSMEQNILQFGFHYVIAGYDIYFGEILLAFAALLIITFVSLKPVNLAGKLQTIFVMILLSGVLILCASLIFNPEVSAEGLNPAFHPRDLSHGGIAFQIISVLVTAPWAYVGYDIVPQLAEESNFPVPKVKSIMDTSILCGCFVYVVLAMIGAYGMPEKFTTWPEYIEALPSLHGVESIAVFSAAKKFLGSFGIILISISAAMAMLTGIVSFFTASSRLLYSMSRENMLPLWFSRLNESHVPVNAVLFCLIISAIAPFAGRNALGWTVDMSSIGGAVSLAYTSLAAAYFAYHERELYMIILGSAGFIFSVMFALLLLIPVEGLDCSLEGPSYILLIVWVILGMIFYGVSHKRGQ